MGVSSSKIEEDKALQLCRERKKLVRQALDGRCSLAAAHVAYISSLRNTGIAIRKFVESEPPVESLLNPSRGATSDPPTVTEKSPSHFSFSSQCLSHPVDATEDIPLSPSSPSSDRFQVRHMKFTGFSSKKVEERPPTVVTGIVTSSSTPPNTTSQSTGKPQFEYSSVPPATPQWDYFGLSHSIDNQLSTPEGREVNHGIDHADYLRQLREDEGIPELEYEEGRDSSHGSKESEFSEDEFDDPSTNNLVQSSENPSRKQCHGATSASPITPSSTRTASETELISGEKSNSPNLSPYRTPSSAFAVSGDTKKATRKEDRAENKVSPKDFVSSIKEIGGLFIKASESGKEVPRMLEANKLHFRPIAPSKGNGSVASVFLKACFSCGEDASKIQEEPAQNGVKYLTWHRTTSSRSSSSRTLLGLNAKDDTEDLTDNLFESSCMISGSNASTLDRLFAWERKLYDEVKASQVVRKAYDNQCVILRQLESKGESSRKIDKTRATVKDLHSRIRVAIHRIDSISARIEELRDKELQPQLEELIEGLYRMWEFMFECHEHQFNILSVAYINGNSQFSIQSESHREITIHLENELSTLSSSFTKWIGAQKFYLQAINNWLFKCVFSPQKPSRRKRRQTDFPLTLRNLGPPIYVTCGIWPDKLECLHSKEVSESIRGLAAETSRLLPHPEKNQGKSSGLTSLKANDSGDLGINMLKEEAAEDCISGFERFRSSLEGFLGQLSKYAQSSVKMYSELEKAIQKAKHNYEKLKAQSLPAQVV